MHRDWIPFVFLAAPWFAARVLSAPISSHIQVPLGLFEDKNGAESIRKALDDANVIPDVLPCSFSPSVSLNIKYSSTKVELGNTIPVPSTSSPPSFELNTLANTPSEALSPTRTLAVNKTYTLVLSDPDATSRAEPVKAQMCHWIITGITLHHPNSTEGLETGDGTTYALKMEGEHGIAVPNEPHTDTLKDLIGYMAPAPPPKTGKHRYVFVLLEPEEGEDGRESHLKKPKERPHFGYGKQGKGVMDWAKDNKLVPVGANFFYSQNEKQ